MWKKLSASRPWLAVLAGLAMVFAFSPYSFMPAVFAVSLLSLALVRLCPTAAVGFRWGFVTSLAIMVAGFYWVTYVIHVFGYLPWSVSAVLFVGFCGFGALNFPVFTALAAYLHQRFQPDDKPGLPRELWYVVGMPALFTLVEAWIPKLFPWYVGHAFFRTFWLNQIVEWTGDSFLTFCVFSLGGAIVLVLETRRWAVLALPMALFSLSLGFSLWRLSEPEPPGHRFRVALIQANIGSLEKAASLKGTVSVVERVMNRYLELSEHALASDPKPQLILWPETALPFSFDRDGAWQERIRSKVLEWKIPLLTGAYADHPFLPDQDYNAAVLLEPQPNGTLASQIYRKNILLAFGEYFPGGELFPALYRYFPQVSHFSRGVTQEPLVLLDGTRLGVTICYEAIVPNFFRRTAEHGVQAVVNLTNDSWFGPTSEPHQHGGLTVFRSIEHRVPLIRVTNTGVSFVVDRWGHMGPQTPVYDEGVLISDVWLPDVPVRTIYLRWGDWFLGLCILGLIYSVHILRRSHAPVPR